MKAFIKMENVIKFGDIEIQKHIINKIVVSNKVSFGKNDFKYFIGDKHAEKSKPLCIFLPKISAYRRDFDENQ